MQNHPWYIQNPGILRNLAYSEPATYSESWCIENLRRIQDHVEYLT